MYIKEKVARGIGILYKSRPYFSLETMRMLYNAFVYPYYPLHWGMGKYMPILFGSSCQAAKTCYQNDCWGQKVRPYLTIVSEFQINTKEMYIYCVQILLHKYHHDLLHSVSSDFYVQNNSVHE